MPLDAPVIRMTLGFFICLIVILERKAAARYKEQVPLRKIIRKMMSTASVTPFNPEAAPLKRRGLMLVLASPPGGGKTSVSRELMRRDPDTTVSVSATTRAKR